MFDPTLDGLLSQVEMDKVVLPAMQRPFVWDEDRMVRLIDSLLRGFPLGAILLWKTKTMQRHRRFRKDIDPRETEVFTYEESHDQDRYLVLDGQQRLTTLLTVLRGSYVGKRFFVDVLSGKTAEKDPGDVYYDGRFLTLQEAKIRNATDTFPPSHHLVAIHELVEIDPRQVALVALQKGQELHLPIEQVPQLTDLYLRAASVMGDKKALQVMFIGETPGAEMPIEEILEIFVRVNSGGLVLQKSDLLMSLLDLKWNEVQPELQTLVSEINAKSRYDFTRDDVLKSLLIAAKSETRFDRLVADRDRLEELAGEMPNHLPGIRHAWNMLIIILNDECRIYSERFFRGGHNALLPFVNWLRLNPAPRPGQRKDLIAGIYIAIMSGVFASAEARMGKFAHDEVQAGHEVPLRALTSLVTRHSGAVTFDQLCARHLDLALNIAHNGITLDGNPDELQRDHIFPRSTLEQQGKPSQLVHHYANFHFLRATDNLNKSNVPPNKWFRNPGREVPPYSDKDLEDRLLTWELIEPGMFETMIQHRSAQIRERAAQLFGRSMDDFEALFGETVLVPQAAVASDGEVAPSPTQGASSTRQEHGAVVERAPWTGYWFVNVGESPHRNWDDNIEYGYIGAGQGEKYSRGLRRLKNGDRFFAYMSGLGYVGYGKVTKEAVPIGNFIVDGLGKPLLELPLRAPRAADNKDSPTNAEWAVGVTWFKTSTRDHARTFKGAFANPNIVCKLRDPKTLEYLRAEFGAH